MRERVCVCVCNYQDMGSMFMMSTDINLSFKRKNCVSTCLTKKQLLCLIYQHYAWKQVLYLFLLNLHSNHNPTPYLFFFLFFMAGSSIQFCYLISSDDSLKLLSCISWSLWVTKTCWLKTFETFWKLQMSLCTIRS